MLGSRKLLIFGIVSALLLSFFIVVASAEDVLKEVDGGILRSPAAPNYILNDSGLRAFSAWVDSEGYTSSSPLYFPFTVYLYLQGQGVGVVEYVFVDDHRVFAHFGNGNSQLVPSIRTLSVDTADGYEWFINIAHVPYEGFDFSNTFDKISGAGSTFLTALLGIGSLLVGFVSSRPIVLIPLVVMLLVLSYGVIRRLIKGV